jgi:hypothetical protein
MSYGFIAWSGSHTKSEMLAGLELRGAHASPDRPKAWHLSRCLKQCLRLSLAFNVADSWAINSRLPTVATAQKSRLVGQFLVLRMSLQDVRDIAAKGNNLQIFAARDIEPEDHDPFGEPAAAELRWHLGVGKQHSVAIPSIFGDRELPADLHFEAAFCFVVDYRRA